MKAFVKRKFINTNLPISGFDLFSYLWTSHINGQQITPSKTNDNVENGYLSVRSVITDNIQLLGPKNVRADIGRDFIYVFPVKNVKKTLCICTDSLEALPIDKCAFYRLTILLAEAQDSDIYEDKLQHWVTTARFKEIHSRVLNSSFSSLLQCSISVQHKLRLLEDEPAFDRYYPDN